MISEGGHRVVKNEHVSPLTLLAQAAKDRLQDILVNLTDQSEFAASTGPCLPCLQCVAPCPRQTQSCDLGQQAETQNAFHHQLSRAYFGARERFLDDALCSRMAQPPRKHDLFKCRKSLLARARYKDLLPAARPETLIITSKSTLLRYSPVSRKLKICGVDL